jgi:hypothetical protein
MICPFERSRERLSTALERTTLLVPLQPLVFVQVFQVDGNTSVDVRLLRHGNKFSIPDNLFGFVGHA